MSARVAVVTGGRRGIGAAIRLAAALQARPAKASAAIPPSTTCTGSYTGFAANHPMWVARWSSSVGALPAGSTEASVRAAFLTAQGKLLEWPPLAAA